jgi:hypothetical protein
MVYAVVRPRPWKQFEVMENIRIPVFIHIDESRKTIFSASQVEI